MGAAIPPMRRHVSSPAVFAFAETAHSSAAAYTGRVDVTEDPDVTAATGTVTAALDDFTMNADGVVGPPVSTVDVVYSGKIEGLYGQLVKLLTEHSDDLRGALAVALGDLAAAHERIELLTDQMLALQESQHRSPKESRRSVKAIAGSVAMVLLPVLPIAWVGHEQVQATIAAAHAAAAVCDDTSDSAGR